MTEASRTHPLSRLRVALVGAGYVARHHLAALSRLPFVDVVGIADVNLAAARELAARYRIPHAATTLEGLRAGDPTVVHVLTPPSSHCALALEAMEMGCHVLVEKPMAETLAECDAMIAAARRKGVVLSVNHSDRFDPVVLRALELVRSGRCGSPLVVDFLRSSDYPAYAGGPLPGMVSQGSYPFRDLGVHGLYLLESFLGPASDLHVEYRGTGANPNLAFDEWHAVAHCRDGLGRLQLSWNVRPMQSRLIVQSTRGVIEVDRFLQVLRVSPVLPGPKFVGMIVGAFVNALRDVWRIPMNVLRFATGSLKPSPGIQRGVEEFARALHEGRAVPVPAEEGRRVIALLEPACLPADAERTRELEARLAPLPPATYLVTGAGGFVGRALVERLLAQGASVRVLVRKVPPWLGNRAQVVLGDLGDPRAVSHAVAGCKRVFHVGAAMKGGPNDHQAGTVWGTRNVVDACLEHGVERLVYVSSMSVMDHAGRPESATLVETSPLEPHPGRRGAYTQCKLAAERHVLEAIRERRLPAVVIRPGQIFGPGAEAVTPNGTIRLGPLWVAVGPAHQTLPLVYIDDAVDALVLAQERPGVVGRIFNVVDTALVTQADYLGRAKRKLDGLRVVRMPRPALSLLSIGVEVLGRLLKRDVPLTRYRVASLRPLANFDVTQAREALGWTPRVGSVEGLRRTFDRDATASPIGAGPA